jgi:hypothetical protein
MPAFCGRPEPSAQEARRTPSRPAYGHERRYSNDGEMSDRGRCIFLFQGCTITAENLARLRFEGLRTRVVLRTPSNGPIYAFTAP